MECGRVSAGVLLTRGSSASVLPAHEHGFSCWFFFSSGRRSTWRLRRWGYQGTDLWYPYVMEQAFGALIALLFGSLWVGRSTRGQDLAARSSEPTVRAERLTVSHCRPFRVHRIAIRIPHGGGSCAALVHLVRRALSDVFTAGLTRVRAEVGPPTIRSRTSARRTSCARGRTAVLGPKSLSVLTMLWYQNRMHAHPDAPSGGMSQSRVAGQNALGKMVLALALGGLIGVPAAIHGAFAPDYSRTYPAMYHPGAPVPASLRRVHRADVLPHQPRGR